MKNKKICEFCGEVFVPTRSTQRYCAGPHYVTCQVCGKTWKYHGDLSNPPKICSYTCRSQYVKEMSLQKYGCTAPGNNLEARKKASATMMKKLGVPYAMMSEDVREKSKQTLLQRYGVDNIRKLKSSEKTKKALEFKFTIYPWDSKEIISKMLQPDKIKLHSSDFIIYRLHKSVGDQFLIENSPLGTCRGQTLYLGLVRDDEVFQVMTFGKASHSRKYDIQLMRLCTKLNYEFEDGYNALFSYATSEYGLYNIIAYCDFSKYDGGDYEQIGMQYDHRNSSRLVWSKDTERCTEQLRIWRKKSKTDMIDEGWLPVYDCGQKVYVY